VAQDSKTGTRAIPLSEAARTVLEAQREQRKRVGRESSQLVPFVFVQDDGTDYTSEERRRHISETARAAAKAAGLGAGVGFHVLRHSAASFMVQAGVPLYEVQKVLGHSSPVLTQRYSHLQPDHLRRAVRALDAALSGGTVRKRSESRPEGPNSVPTRAVDATAAGKSLGFGSGGQSRTADLGIMRPSL